MRSEFARFEFVRPDWDTLADEWRALEGEADGSFFQSWTWVGCRARLRFTDPWLLRALAGSRIVGLALFNRTGLPGARTLRLHETGRRAHDSVFIEHNGPLLARNRPDLLRPMLQAARRHGRLILSGVGDEVLAQARAAGCCHIAVSRPAPFATLRDPVPKTSGAAAWLGRLSASTRYQLRRSRRRYEVLGPLVVERAADVAEGRSFLAALAALHQASWIARGHRGAFAEPEFMAFHHALIATGLPRGEVELLRVSAVGSTGHCVVGYLYNLRWQGRICAYQSGFDYAAAEPHQTPGLTCHHLAIETAIASGALVYDFLAGAARYKSSLGDGQVTMHWLELAGAGMAHGLLYDFRRYLDFRRYVKVLTGKLSRLVPRSAPLLAISPRTAVPAASAARLEMTRESMLTDKPILSQSRHNPANLTALPAARERLGWPLAAALIAALSLAGWALIAYAAYRYLVHG